MDEFAHTPLLLVPDRFSSPSQLRTEEPWAREPWWYSDTTVPPPKAPVVPCRHVPPAGWVVSTAAKAAVAQVAVTTVVSATPRRSDAYA